MNNKGFTLLELLGVFILIAVISLIAVSLTSKYVEQAHIESTKTSANALVRSAQDYYADIMTETGTFAYQEIEIADSKELLNFKGKLPDAGYITIEPDSTINVYLVQYDYCIIVTSTSEDTEVTNDLTKCGIDGGILPDPEPQLKPDYVLKDTVLDGVDDFYDSGYSLFDTNKDFTIITSFVAKSTQNSSAPPTIFHCLYEASPYPGIGVDHMYANGRLALKTPVQSIFPTSIANNKEVFAIRRNITTSMLEYFVFNTSGIITKVDVTSKTNFTNFDQHLIIGAYQNTSGTKGRFFKGTINNFSLYMQSLDDETIKNIMTELNS